MLGDTRERNARTNLARVAAIRARIRDEKVVLRLLVLLNAANDDARLLLWNACVRESINVSKRVLSRLMSFNSIAPTFERSMVPLNSVPYAGG